jgi:hypothetical protein
MAAQRAVMRIQRMNIDAADAMLFMQSNFNGIPIEISPLL